MVSLNKYEYYYVQGKDSIMRNNDKQKTRKKVQDKLIHFDNLIGKVNKMQLQEITKQNLSIFATNSLLVTMKDLDKENKKYLKEQLHKRKIAKYIKIRNIKQLIKKMILSIKY